MTKRTKPEGTYQGSESSFQKAAIKLVRSIAKCDSRLVTHIPNGGQRTIMAGARLKAEGVVAGYPDIMVFACEPAKVPDDEIPYYHPGIAIELKVWPNKPSAGQEDIQRLLKVEGWRVAVCYGLGEVEQVTREYFGG